MLNESDGIDPDLVLDSLLHAHHIRAAGNDKDDERMCVRLAHAAATHADPSRSLFEELCSPYFDEGVRLARRLPGNPARLVRTLTDRSMFLVAARSFEYADVDEVAAQFRHR
ncbi:hypothetical protein [Streptomyces fagopyri]|uniref:hypothetical protein n=1 Tax=Streptomyces fagopyri TaxID=2662397 RepID=UPI0033C0ECB9